MSIEAVEDAMLATITTQLGNKLRKVDTLPGPLDVDLLTRLAASSPGAYVSFLGGRNKKTDKIAMVDGVFALYVLVNHAGGHRAKQRGAANVIGAYDILNALIPHLNHLDITDVGVLRFQQVQNLFKVDLDKKGVMVYAATFLLPNLVFEFVDDTVLDDFETFNADIDMAPADGTIDITVNETLPIV